MANAAASASKSNHLTRYKTSLTRDSLKWGYYKPIEVTVVEKTPLDEKNRAAFYHPAVVLLDKIFKARNELEGKGGESNG